MHAVKLGEHDNMLRPYWSSVTHSVPPDDVKAIARAATFRYVETHVDAEGRTSVPAPLGCGAVLVSK